MLIPLALMFGGRVAAYFFALVAAIVGSALIAMVGGLVMLVFGLGGFVLLVLSMIKMVSELNTVTRNAAFPWWPVIVPFYNIYWWTILVPQQVTEAKRIVGLQQPARGPVLYLFLFPWALASDINEIAARVP
jgi:sulfite exporter TauE/SafE